ncbi:MAG TPA: FAD-binding protein [Ilumatobacteraceae bacterium]|nr:FAD-binding protein [Ilumatobacteraceae bacterium]
MGVKLDDAVAEFVTEVGSTDPVTIAGTASRGGAVPGVRAVVAPAGISSLEPAEMTIRCGAATPVAEVDAALAEHGQCVAIPTGGTIGGAVAVGQSGIRRLGWGPLRDTVLQVHYVSAAGELVKAGGPTVKNVSGFDLCRLLVGSRGTLGFLAELILRTRPLPAYERWFRADGDPWELLGALYRPTSVLWNGEQTWVLLGGHPGDVAGRARSAGLVEIDGPPVLPPHRWSLPPSELADLRSEPPGSFVAEVGVGVVHHSRPRPAREPDVAIVELHRRLRAEFDPTARLNPGVDVLVS